MIKFFGYIYNTFVFKPLAGGNGVIQLDEMAKAVLVVMICIASHREGKTPEQVYPDIYWIMIFASVCAIAAIKPAFAKFKELKHDNDTTS